MLIKPLNLFSGGFGFDFSKGPDKVSTFRRILPQFLSCLSQYINGCNMGLVLAISSIVVPSIIGRSTELNPDETLHMTPEKASWLASLMFIIQPIGCILSPFFADSLGRKWATFLTSFVPAFAWILLPNVQSEFMIYVGFLSLGIWNGLTSSLSIYLNEICEASIRGVMCAMAGIAATTGIFMVFLLGSFLSWRQVSYICAIVPILNILLTMLIPESPIFLVSNHRTDQAEKSLQVLRGWVSSKTITPELDQLKRASELSASCVNCEKSGQKCNHPPPTLFDKLKDITRKRTLKPFSIISILFLLMQFSGMFAMRPYIVPILNAHGIAFSANFITVMLGVLGILANICIALTVRTIGKRRIYLYSMVGNFVSCFGLSIYGWVFFPRGWTSVGTNDSDLESIRESVGVYNYFALAMFLIMQFCISIGVSSIPYFLQGEIFPFKSRTFCCSLTGMENQLFAFVATKTFYDFERWLSLPGVIGFYGVIAVLGFILMIFMIPETENRTLEEIELHFSDNKRSIFDINIKK
ncbi:facilitated trehalose transporter Tret1-like [Contarinia nasturtii]|uniref:facilitated trehalose transporter Tret1-like n=1 Tax=Contarinia nasturtii TaxID=265458 RepID=UPI0012D46D9B|nr:facilitated trehalose transporter Tret1-like [Contarinia nasturtii]XP_031639276.1 facilitated trehalose transporter Tret1-like [Contarinia nasturtii]